MKLNIKKVCILVLLVCLILSSFSICFAVQNPDNVQEEPPTDPSKVADWIINNSHPKIDPVSLLKDVYIDAMIPMLVVLTAFIIDFLLAKNKRTFFQSSWVKYSVAIGGMLLIPLTIYISTLIMLNSM